MTPRQRTTGLAALGLLASWAVWPAPVVPAAQQPPMTPEPPVVGPELPGLGAPGDAPLPGAPAGTPPGLLTPPGAPAEGPLLLPPGAPPPGLVTPPPVLAPAGPLDPPAPVVAIRVCVAACSAPLREIEYRICVENTSAAPAHHVLVRNPMPPNAHFVRASPEPHLTGPELQWRLGTLAPGACRDITLVLAPIDTCDVKNCARVQFEHGQCVTTRIVGSAPSPLPGPPGIVPPFPPGAEEAPAPGITPEPKAPGIKPEPKAPGAARLSLSMTGPKRQYANLTAKYQLTVRNEGTAAATRVLIANPIPTGMTLVGASAGSRLHMGQVAWFLGDLAAGEAKTVQIVLRARRPGELCNRATALADNGLKAEAELCTRFEGVSALGLEVTDTKDPLPVGEETSYVIVIVNQGSVPVTNVRVKALVPPEVMLVRARGDSDVPPKDKLPEATAEGQLLPFAPLKSLDPGKQARYEVFVRAVRPGDVRFKVEIAADQLEAGPVNEQESTQVFPADAAKRP